MALHYVHNAASTARQKTAAKIQSVFSSPRSAHRRSKSSPLSLPSWRECFGSQDDLKKNDPKEYPPGGTDSSSSSNSNKFSTSNGSKLSNSKSNKFTAIHQDAFHGDTSDDDGYVTAAEDSRDFTDSDSNNSSTRSSHEFDVHRVVSYKQSFGQFNIKRYDSNGIPRELEISEIMSVNALRDSVLDLDAEEKLKHVDDATLLRFLRARNMDVSKAADMLLKDFRWRVQFAPQGGENFSEDVIANQLAAEKAYLQGIDKKGRPLLISMGCKHFSKGRDMEEFRRFCYYCLEKIVASMPEGQEKFVTIFDSGGTGYRNLDISASLMMVDFLQSHYPERMAKVFIIHTSNMVQGAFKLMDPAIDIKTRQKIVFVSDNDLESVLREEIGEECLPQIYGGKADLVPIQYAQINKEVYPCGAVYSKQ